MIYEKSVMSEPHFDGLTLLKLINDKIILTKMKTEIKTTQPNLH
jgi:hypothetical protein